MFSPTNILHFQVPFTKLSTNWVNKLKLSNTTVVYNSNFTKSIIDPQLGITGKVIHPPINFHLNSNAKKTNTILSVGRFTKTLHNKRQDILISAFKSLIDQGLSDWKLILAGSTHEKEAKQMLTDLKSQSIDYPIEFQVNVTSSQLTKSYNQAKIFWLATGFDIDEEKHPEQVEHFGIVTAEAMSAGCVPVVINKGGQKEIITHNKTGLFFKNEQEIIEHTLSLTSQPKLLSKLSKAAATSAKQYSPSRFCQQFSQLT